MKKLILSFIIILVFTINIYSQTEDQTTIKGLWTLFKGAVVKEDFEAIKGLCRLPLMNYYFSEGLEETNDLQKYFGYFPGEFENFENIKSQIKNIYLPEEYKFYDKNSANRFYNNFNVTSGTEVYYVTIEGWHFSAADLYIIKIEGMYYIIGDDSWEYEG
ncbi:MAG TPA: hypothetical protein VIL99_17460 [Ignavibacteria bacterium]